MANLIPSLAELRAAANLDRQSVKDQIHGRKAIVVVPVKAVKRQEVVLMNRSNVAEFKLAPVSEIVGGTQKTAGQGRKALAKKAIETAREERAAQRKFVAALFNFIGFWEACSLQERATMAKKTSTGSRARLIASDVLAAPVVETTVETTNRPRWAHVTVKAETSPQQRAAMTRKGNAERRKLEAQPVWKQVTADQLKAAKLAFQQKRLAVMAVVSAIFGLLAEKRALQGQVNWNFARFTKSVAMDVTVELRAQIQDLNGQIETCLLSLRPADMRFLAFKAYRMIVGQERAATKRQAKADAAFWRAVNRKDEDTYGSDIFYWDGEEYAVNCTFDRNQFMWSLGEVLAA